MTKAAFTKQGGTLIPCDDDGREILAALQDGKQVIVHVHAARNPRHHRLLFILHKKLAEAGVWDGDSDSFLTWAKLGTGHVDQVVGPNGRVYYVPKSINFESMPQDAFARWWDRVLFLVFDRLIDGDQLRLRNEIAEIVDGDLGQRAREHADRYGAAA